MRLRPTRGGRYFVALLLVVTFAAYNTSNNLIYLMLSVGLAALPVAAAAGYLSLRALRLEWSGTEDAYAGTPFREAFGLRSASRLFDAFGVTVDGKATIAVVGKEMETVRAERLFAARGAYRGEPVVLESSFPLGLFSLSRRVVRERDLIVFPAVRPVDGSVLSREAAGQGTGGASSGGSEDFYGLREYVRGDHVHHIHWKTSARVGELMVRQLGRGRDERVLLVLDRAGASADEAFELLVTATASLASHLVAAGVTFGFLTDELELRPDAGRAHLKRVLTYLALVERSDARSGAQTWRGSLEARAKAGFRVLAFATGDGPGLPLPGAVRLDPERVLA